MKTHFTNFMQLDVSRATGFPEFPNMHCSHMTTTRSMLGIMGMRRRLATHILLLNTRIVTQFVGNQAMLTGIMSTIPHELVHHVFINM
jgi:hypothetical protein